MTLFWLFLGVFFFLYWLLYSIRYSLRSSVLYLWLLVALYCALTALLGTALPVLYIPPAAASLCVLIYFLLSLGKKREFEGAPDLILVLGVRQDGTQPSRLFRDRVEEAATLSRAFPAVPILLAGGKVFGEKEAEAEEMKKALLAMGIGKERLHCEAKSRTTFENFFFNKAQLEGKKVAVITSLYHAPRAFLFAKGLVPTGKFSLFCRQSGGLFLIHLYTREVITLTVDLLRGRLSFPKSRRIS